MRAPQPRVCNGDHDDIERQRQAIRATCPEALARVERFALESFVLERWPGLAQALEIGEVDEAGLEDAADEVLRSVHGQLVGRGEGEVLHRLVARDLARHRWRALEALFHLHAAQKYAKERVVEIAAGRPLAICIGPRAQRPTSTAAGVLTAAPQGCYSIFADQTRGSGKMWPVWCDTCKPRTGRRKPHRDHDRALRRRVAALGTNPSVVWTFTRPRLDQGAG